MEGLLFLLVVLAVGCILCGPIALIISIIALNRSREIYPAPQARQWKPDMVPRGREDELPKVTGERFAPPEKAPEKPAEEVRVEAPLWPTKAKAEQIEERTSKEKAAAYVGAGGKQLFGAERKADIQETRRLLEQQIGTRWILIAGIVTVVFGIGFFLKYAYDSGWIGPTGRVMIAAVSGLVALTVGEITRRRGYGIVAKGVIALGFALLYLAVFAAHRYYGLIPSIPAFALAVLITASAMLFAVAVDEIVTAFLSLLGGFLTPVIVSTGENLPMPLFGYVTVLSIGAMLCAYYRKWRAVDLLCFVGTFALYTGWFEKFYRPATRAAEAPQQMAMALVWLGVFFGIYLVLPVLYALIKKVKAQIEDVLLVLANAAVVFYYLWTILFDQYRVPLAFCAVGLCAAHLVTMRVVVTRCKADVSLQLALLAIGLFFLTIAVPLYFRMYAVAMAWAVEAVILVVLGLRYRSLWTQAAGAVALSLSLGELLVQLPMHTGAFLLVLNPAFGTWCFVAAAVLICHVIYSKRSELSEDVRGPIAQILYGVGVLLLLAAVTMEWWWHCDYNLAEKAYTSTSFPKGMVLIFAVFTLLFIIRPIRPLGTPSRILAAILAAGGAVFTSATFGNVYRESFVIFANMSFVIVGLFVAALLFGGWLLKRAAEQEEYGDVFATFFTLGAIFVLWVLLTQQIYLYWYCRNRFAERIANWRFLAHMYISVMWAVYGAGLMALGFWRKWGVLRFVALGLFAMLLCKVFIFDTSTVKSVYRIAAFLATGVTLVGVSYLYQFLRKKGFFDAVLAESNTED
ncbi:MAG: DUF2339 domain-containing protein [Planctomycetota bacterium]|jgi:uncharacterized membrane protein